MRVALFALILFVGPTLSGCLGGAEYEGLAKPTDKPIVVPPTRLTPTLPPTFNTSDPGYRVDTPWRMGDGWDYQSDRENVRRVRVLDQRLVNGTSLFMLETTYVAKGGAVLSINRSWVDPRGWLLLNDTAESGAGDRYHPGMPLRFWRNASATFVHERLGPGGAATSNETVTLSARLYPMHQTLQFSWGYVEAKRVEHLVATKRADGTRTTQTTIHWVHKDYLNDVQFELPDGETYKLTAARAGDFRRGQLA